MSKKNLARTAIEGGRRGYNTWERRESNQLERVRTRMMLRAAVRDLEVVERRPLPKRRPVRPEFNDKLNAVYAWIAAQSGRTWNEVRSEVHRKFDSRTTAGRHILCDHILKHVDYTWHVGPYVDTQFTYGEHDVVGLDGVLRHVRGKSYKSRWRGERPTFREVDLWSWANGRYVRRIGSVLFWFVPVDPTGLGPAWRQGRALNEDEIEFYDVLSEGERRKLTGQE